MQRTQELYVPDKNKRFRPSGRMAKQILEKEKELCDAIKALAGAYKKVEDIVEGKRDELLTLLCHIEPQYNTKGKKLTTMIIEGAIKYVIKTLCESDEHLHNIRKSMHRSQQGGKGINKEEAQERRVQMSQAMLKKAGKEARSTEELKYLEQLCNKKEYKSTTGRSFKLSKIVAKVNEKFWPKSKKPRSLEAVRQQINRLIREKDKPTFSQNPPGPPLAGPSAASEVGGNQPTANADGATQSSAPVE